MDTALALLRRVGVKKLSLRALAKELGVTPMAIYRHVPSKQALLDEMRSSVLELVPIIDEQAPQAVEGRGQRTLSEEEIVTEALAVVKSAGLSALSMRLLAKRLKVSAMSIYRYVPDKAALLSRMVDVLVEELPRPTPTRAAWKQEFRDHAHRMWEKFAEYPGIVGSFASGPSPSVLVNMEYQRSILLASGAEPRRAALASTTFSTFLLGLFRSQAYLDHLVRQKGAKTAVSTGVIRRYGERLALGELLDLQVDAIVATLVRPGPTVASRGARPRRPRGG